MESVSSTPNNELLTEILAFCEEREISKSAFGDAALKDPSFVFDLEKGRECRRATVRAVRDFMASEAAQ